MGLRVNTNISSMTAQRNLGAVTTRLQANFARLASGLRISSAADDAAGLGISERMRSQIRSYGAARRNAQDGISLVQTAEGALNEVNNIITRMRELAIQAANGTLSSSDRGVIDVEFQELISEIDRIAGTSTFNGVTLLNGATPSLDIQAGIQSGETITITLPNTTAGPPPGLALQGLDMLSATNALTALANIDAATNTVVSARGSLGAAQNRMTSVVESIANARENLAAAESRIRDVDIAEETADLTRNTIMQQAATSILSQANTQPQLALNLLQG